MVEKACVHCGTPFVARTPQQKFCSEACRPRFYRAQNLEKYNAKAREWMRRARINDKARIYAHNVKHRQKPESRKRAAELSRIWHANNSEHANKGRKVRKQIQRVQKPWTVSVRGAFQRSKKKNIPFDLTYEWAEARWTGRCELTDIPFALGMSNESRSMFAPSVDKIVASKGYTQANCRFVLHCVNTFKYTGTDADIYRVAEALLASGKLMPTHPAGAMSGALSLPT